MASGNRKRCSRKTPNKHAEEWIKREEDPPGFSVRFFENKGRGVITTTAREKGEFLLVYRGEVVTKEEGERREEKDGGTGYRLFYKASGKQLWGSYLYQGSEKVVTWWTDGPLALDRPQAPDTLLGTLPLANEQHYPNVRRCLLVLLTMPVSTATAERSFSTMKRSTMTTERLSGLGLMNIYRDMKIYFEYIVDKFAARKERRLAFVFRE